MNVKIIIASLAVVLIVGCTNVHRGVVAMKINDTEAHVCLNKGEVAIGDTVSLYRNICSNTGSKAVLTKCEKRPMGTGTVTQALNEHYSVISVAKGTDFKEGDFVER